MKLRIHQKNKKKTPSNTHHHIQSIDLKCKAGCLVLLKLGFKDIFADANLGKIFFYGEAAIKTACKNTS